MPTNLTAIRERHKPSQYGAKGFCQCGRVTPCDATKALEALDAIEKRLEEARLEGGKDVWESVLSLPKSGTPPDGLIALAEYNIKGLAAALKASE